MLFFHYHGTYSQIGRNKLCLLLEQSHSFAHAETSLKPAVLPLSSLLSTLTSVGESNKIMTMINAASLHTHTVPAQFVVQKPHCGLALSKQSY